MNGNNNMTEKCLVEQTKRDRVNGTGPKRNQLVVFKKLGEVSDETFEYLNKFLDENTHSDIGSDDYSISRSCNYEKVFNVGQSYRQVILQKSRANNHYTVDEYIYDKWIPGSEVVQQEMKNFFDTVYRFRLSEMQPDHELNWHIDSDTSVICRAQICLNENNSTFLFKDKQGIHEFKMKPKEIWFVNTGWSHTVKNDSGAERRVAILGFNFNDLKSDLQKEIQL
jgi:hypothetical protein